MGFVGKRTRVHTILLEVNAYQVSHRLKKCMCFDEAGPRNQHQGRQGNAKNAMLAAVLPFSTQYRLGHPEFFLFFLSNNIFIGSKYPKINKLKFEKKLH